MIREALPADFYADLQRTFPSEDLVIDGREKKDTWYDYLASRVIRDERLTEQWRDFFRYHVSRDFFREFADKLGPMLREVHPSLEARLGKKLEDFNVAMRPGGRHDPHAEGADVSMECQFYINRSWRPRAVRGPHVDRPTELFAALLYFRRDDDSTGGDLDINQAPAQHYPKPDCIKIDKLPMELDLDHVETVNTVPYQPNTLALFLSSERSLHSVTPRTPTRIPRRHINFCGDITKDLFELKRPPRLALKHRLKQTPLLWRLSERL